mmetsp:Transcript_19658/g.63879  ORF Transcript_19658/g.63879 Transcript_19658/m.63879 type:complete len:282 (+) Transcript_19658:483-1328(+)
MRSTRVRVRQACEVRMEKASALPSTCCISARNCVISLLGPNFSGLETGVPPASSTLKKVARSCMCMGRAFQLQRTGLKRLWRMPTTPWQSAAPASAVAAAAAASAVAPASPAMTTHVACVSEARSADASPASSAATIAGASKNHGSSPGFMLFASVTYALSHPPISFVAPCASMSDLRNSGERSTWSPLRREGPASASSHLPSNAPSCATDHAGAGFFFDTFGKLNAVALGIGAECVAFFAGFFRSRTRFAISWFSGWIRSASSKAAMASSSGPTGVVDRA